ncbi:MAG: FAD-dependent oxidoreductase [Gammaproteobacteria bacterium]|nr:MAG: FAD-dependent oxidoreductase [Gammaproteobacteria bacterium]
MRPSLDLIVVGAGIQGAGVAEAAAAAGHSVLVLEQAAAPAAATSSRSSKLIHGGLRYLEHGDFALVRRCLAARRRLLRLAPHRVRLLPFFLPVYDDSPRGPLVLRLGLLLYDVLAMGGAPRHRRLPRAAHAECLPLRQDGLLAVFRYYDAATDDAALTRSVLESAQRLGARALFEARFEGAEWGDAGVKVHWREAGGARRTLDAAALVLATGPWIERSLAGLRPPLAAPPLEYVQGSHIVLCGELGERAYYLQAPDGRGVFVAPWRGRLLVGTTERPYAGDPAAVRPGADEIEELLGVFNHHFPGFYGGRAAGASDVLEAFAGLRVLPAGRGATAARSRRPLLWTDPNPVPRVLAVCGGKLTLYHETAEAALQRLGRALPARPRRADLDRLPLP